jgi:hypothetical protein
MARRKARVRSKRSVAKGAGAPMGVVGSVDPSAIPRLLLGAVDRAEVVAVGALQFTRDVLLSAVSGAANIGAEALTATVGGTRGVVSAAFRMVGDIAGAARGSVLATIDSASRSRRAPVRLARGRPALPLAGEPGGNAASVRSTPVPRSRRRARRLRSVTRPVRPSAAA